MSTEAALVSQLRSGKEEAFQAVVAEQHGALIRSAMRYVANKETAEEVVQETWVAVIQGLNRFEERSSLRAWIYAILIHKAKDRGMREKRQMTFSDFERDHDDHRDAIDSFHFRQRENWFGFSAFPSNFKDDRTPEQLLAAKQAVACLQRAIEVLPTGLKDVLILRDVQGVQTEEVCKKLNISETNLYVRLYRARAKVRITVEAVLG
jgi:RNA polymerase sigma-70 factor (ECF subfamily)